MESSEEWKKVADQRRSEIEENEAGKNRAQTQPAKQAPQPAEKPSTAPATQENDSSEIQDIRKKVNAEINPLPQAEGQADPQQEGTQAPNYNPTNTPDNAAPAHPLATNGEAPQYQNVQGNQNPNQANQSQNPEEKQAA